MPAQEVQRRIEKIRPNQKHNKDLDAAIEHTLGLSTEDAASGPSAVNGIGLNTSQERSNGNGFEGNRYQGETPKSSFSATSKFHSMREKDKGKVEESKDDFQFFMESSILLDLLSEVSRCPECSNKITSIQMPDAKLGLCQKIIMRCQCTWEKEIYSSRQTKQQGSGRKAFDVNNRAIVAFREIGAGFASMERFCGFMNMRHPMSKSTYFERKSKIHDAYISVCQEIMKDAAIENRQLKQEDFVEDMVSDIDASFDGTWQRRGHVSLNGVVTAISQENGKCVDYEVLSKTCQACKIWERKKETDTEGYNQFQFNHVCSINHKGTSGSMESKAAVEIFKRSVEVNKLRYKKYIGDGDSSAFLTVVNSKPYENLTPEKGECIGHVQKRVGTRLKKLKKSCKEKLSDGKTLNGKGRLTEKVINTLQNAYGLVIRQNVGNLYEMKKGVGALLFHYSENEDMEKRHHFCPRGATSWCKYQSDKVTGKKTYKESLNIPPAIREKIKPIFMDLSSDDLLSKCLHGKTQNVNESLNQIIWKRCPKNIFVERFTLEIGVASAIISFNAGTTGMIKVLKMLGLEPGYNFENFCYSTDTKRQLAANVQSSRKAKLRRKKLRAIKKGFLDNETEEEEKDAYSSGNF